MVENVDNETHLTNASVNQSAQDVQSPPTPNVVQPSVQPTQSTQTGIQQPEITKSSDGEKPKKGKKAALVVALVLLILALVVGGVFVMQKYSKPDIQSTEEQQDLTNTPTINQQQLEPETASSDNGCDSFPDMLEVCIEYACEFTHPITGEQMTREIVGINNGKCNYLEQMPNGGKMDCEYTEEMRIAVAKYHRDLVDSESFGTDVSAELNPEGLNVDTTYTIDGKVVDNPLQEALDTSQCVVTGY